MRKLIVIKLGGSIIDRKDSAILGILELIQQGWSVVIVHGGGKLVTQWMNNQGIDTQFYQGERITDKQSLEVVIAVLAGLANKETTAAFCAAGVNAVGLSGVDGALIQGSPRDNQLGYVGKIEKVNSVVLETLLQAGFVPIISPIGLNTASEKESDPLLLNINGDTVAGEIAAEMKAALLLFLTDVNGVQDASGNVINHLDVKKVDEIVLSKVAQGGMIPKLKACERAAQANVVCRIVDGRKPQAVLSAVNNRNTGSTISASGR
ncbi:MAG: acetylglutamate kinase [Dehalococcoidia bacterium]|nr:acetylglutamate kinase [Dehalococcoidia bacterium]